jgi:integral membrane protein
MNVKQSLEVASRVEGISLLCLFLVAMPLKYVGGFPFAVTFAGSAHGLLFLWFCARLFHAHLELGLHWRTSLGVLFSAAMPFGFLWIGRQLSSTDSPKDPAAHTGLAPSPLPESSCER